MPCPHCSSTATTRRKRRTALGYPRFSCRCCRRRFNERTGKLVRPELRALLLYEPLRLSFLARRPCLDAPHDRGVHVPRVHQTEPVHVSAVPTPPDGANVEILSTVVDGEAHPYESALASKTPIPGPAGGG